MQIIERGLMTQADYDEASRKALSLFEYGQVILFCYSCIFLLESQHSPILVFQQVALEHGMILVDTKYEFGKGEDGSILLIDEVQ